jgi:hypothetical protein
MMLQVIDCGSLVIDCLAFMKLFSYTVACPVLGQAFTVIDDRFWSGWQTAGRVPGQGGADTGRSIIYTTTERIKDMDHGGFLVCFTEQTQ